MTPTFPLTACALAACTALAHAQNLPESTAEAGTTASTPAKPAATVDTLSTVRVTGKRAHRVSKGATGLPMEIKETPQTISTLEQREMADFDLSGSNEALGLATGINVDQWETNRATFNARGFDIQLTQIDGLGMTNAWGTVVGREDTFLFDRIELIRGANGLLTGVGNASGTINYVRKRPKNTDGALFSATVGSYGRKRVAADVNKVLTEDGTWAARLVVAHEDKDSHLRALHDQRTSVYGVIDGQIGTDGMLTVGLTAIDNKQDSPMWGSLTMRRADGSQAEYDTSASTSQDWTYWNTKSKSAFVEYTHRLSPDWEAKATYTYRHGNESTKLLYAYSTTGVLNNDNTGLVGWPYRSDGSSDNSVLDVNLNGEFTALGRRHSLLVGASHSKQKTAVDTYAALTHMLDALPAFPYGGNVYTEPTWGTRQPSTRGEQDLTRLYAASRITLTDTVKAIAGLNAVHLARSGASIYGSVATNTVYPDTQKVSPYAGLTVDITRDVMAYASTSSIFQNQDQTAYNGEYLAPMKGVNTEVGLKTEWLDRRMLSTFAVFTAKQNGLATYAGINASGNYWYEPKNVKSRGFEFETTGRINTHAKATLGYTHLRLTGPDGGDIYEWIPRNTVNFRVDSALPMLPALRLGAGGRWQSRVSKDGGAQQGAYLVANAFAAYEVSPATTVRLNINNLFDKKYLGGLAWGAIYGAPRNAALTLEYKL